MAADSKPPPINKSIALLPVVNLFTCSLLFRRSMPDWNPMFREPLAAIIIFLATDSVTPEASISSPGLATAILIMSSYPAVINFSAVAAPTPGRFSIEGGFSLFIFIITYFRLMVYIFFLSFFGKFLKYSRYFRTSKPKRFCKLLNWEKK